MKKTANYYKVLGVSPNASVEEIRAAAQRLSQKFPEEEQDPDSNIAYRQLVRAHDVLSDPDRRAAYDEQLAQSGSDLLGIELLPSRRTLGNMKTEQLLYLLINIFAPAAENRQRLPINLCLVFDRSTSMRGERLKRIKTAARQVIHSLSSEDVVSVVTFSDRASVILSAGHVKNKNVLLSAINQIEADGGTEIYQGLAAGIRELQKAPLSRYVNNLVLMTDGQTYGDEDACLDVALAAAGKGITINAFGIGTDWNDRFLDQLVSPGGGQSAYIEEADQIVSRLREQIKGLGSIYAQDLKLAIDIPGTVTCKDVFKVAPFAQPLQCPRRHLNLGALESALPLSILLELGVDTQYAGNQIPLAFEIEATIPTRHIRGQRFKRTLTLSTAAGAKASLPPQQVLQAVQMLNLHRMNEKAWEELQAGDTDKATRRMEHLTARLREAGHEELAQQAMMETQRLAHIGTLSLEGRKKLKYGTRSLITKTMQLAKDD